MPRTVSAGPCQAAAPATPATPPRAGRPRLGRRLAAAAVAALLAAACGALAPAPTPRPMEPIAPALPPIPHVDGPLALDLVYPAEDAELTVRDSTFVFGSTGTGEAALRINDAPVPVEANGAFLAFLAVPPDGVYRLEATAHGQTTSLERRVELPPPPPQPAPGEALIVAGSPYPAGTIAVPAGEVIEVGFIGTAAGRAALILPDGTRVPLVERSLDPDLDWAQRVFGAQPSAVEPVAPPGLSAYRGIVTAAPLAAADPAVPRPILEPYSLEPVAPFGAHAAPVFELVVAADTATAPLPVNTVVLDPDRLPAAVLHDPDIELRSDRMIVGRPGPGHTFHYFWPNGTEVLIDGERNQELRVRLSPGLTAWVAAEQVVLLPPGAPPPAGPVGTIRLTPYDDVVDARIELPARLPFRVVQDNGDLHVLVYGGQANTAWLQYGRLDPFVRHARWDQPADGLFRLTLQLAEPPWGYRSFWDETGDLVVRVRRPPPVDPDNPLRDLRIVVDAGHPPLGAIGPTRLTEAEANLAIALRLQRLLEQAGARVLMTRTGPESVPLHLRPQIATDADAHILVSVHNNAFPDGVNPFISNGTSTYYFHPHAIGLARALQAELLAELRLRDIGIGRANLALVRPTWMPAALTESMFMMIPEQEAALRNPAVQERIAAAHVRAIEAFVRSATP